MSGVLSRLEGLLREQGGVIARLLEAGRVDVERAGPVPPAGCGPAQRAGQGPRAAADPVEYELLIEAIYEGYLLHYGVPRLLRPAEADLALLAGDQLYALGLARLVRLGDIDAVGELADVITLCALAHGAGEPDLARAVWDAGARAIGWGSTSEHERAKGLARAGAAGALQAMREAAAL